jgi:ABC-type multidrug transport system ATPase subunit
MASKQLSGSDSEGTNKMLDVERQDADTSYLANDTVTNLTWSNVTVTVKDRETKQPKALLQDVNGSVEAGEMLAIMGPSGCGKTTLLNVLARRDASAHATVAAEVLVNGQMPSLADFRQLSSYVEQDDALIGALTVRETLYFAARLSLSGMSSATERIHRIEQLIQAFGLTEQANTIIGTLVKKGISGGQRRRVSVAAQLISAPKILFLDEPTSGLDSEASLNVMSFVKSVTKANGLIVISSIHQPSTTTFELFDKLLLLSRGKTCYFGALDGIRSYFEGIGFPLPLYANPADYLLSITNIDFERNAEAAKEKLATIHDAWKHSSQAKDLAAAKHADMAASNTPLTSASKISQGHNFISTSFTLLHRSFIKSRRDVVVYGLRFIMYLGFAILLGTVWLRLPPNQTSIQPYTNCIFFASAFMSFMAVVYVPAFVEDRAVYAKDRANGLYGSAAFMLSNFLVGLPYLFLITLVSASFTYWMVNFRPDGTAFMVWVLWNYLNLVAAESLVVLMTALFPNFVGALALTAMANGMWMACNGFMVPITSLNPFYHYVFYFINYQAYVFRGLAENEFGFRNYDCGEGCFCMYDTPLKDQCQIAGTGVLENIGFDVDSLGMRVGIALSIVAGLRLLGWAALHWRK